MKHSIFTFLLFIMIGATLQNCSVKQESFGKLDEIFVFCDSLAWQDYRHGLGRFFGQTYLTPIPEEEYRLHWRPSAEIRKYHSRRNLMFLALLDQNDPVSEYVKSLLSEEIMAKIRTGEFFYIPQKDVWATGQYVVYLVAPNKEAMLQRLYDLGELVLDDFEKSYYTRLQREMYRRYENKDLEAYLLKHYPFTLRIQHDYKIVDESLKENYVWLRRLHPARDRSMFIHWLPLNDSLVINREWLIRERNRIAGKIYEGDRIVEPETELKRFKFLRWPAMRLEGTWMNPKYVVGGPFRNITFIDHDNNLIFMIDFYVQAIGERKKIFLDQLEVMAHTFQLKSDLNRKEKSEK